DRIAGPTPYQPSLVNPDLEANLFELREVDLDTASKLARAAIERAALKDPASVTRMEIARQTLILPSPASGEIRWTLNISSGRESAQVFADAHGTITGANLDGTDRAKTVDMLRDFKLAADAARSFRYVLGADSILLAVNIAPQNVGFQTNMA